MNFSCGAGQIPRAQAERCSDAVRIARCSIQADPQSWFCTVIMIEFSFGSILADDEIHAAIAIVIAQSAAPLLSVNFYAGGLTRDGVEISFSIPGQP